MAAATRASVADQKQAEKLAAQLHAEERAAEVAAMNAQLAETYTEIDGLLAATLAVDDYVDLESLRVASVQHPPFSPGHLATTTPTMDPLVYPPEPVYEEPAAPKGMFASKKKHEDAIARAQAAHQEAVRRWNEHNQALYAGHVAEFERRRVAEQQRLTQLAAAEDRYRQECQAREEEARSRNEAITKFINDLAFDVPSAIEEYVGVVLSNSVYPESFPVAHEHTFDLATRELTMTAMVPEPAEVPVVKEFRYVKSKDEISPAPLPAREQKDRYAGAVWQVAVRTLHEVFEADRAGRIHSISLSVATSRIAPATGLTESIPLVQVAADRNAFTSFDLARVVPKATLEHLGAALSKSPFDLTPADIGPGVRTRKV
ncbi:hypothetical protein ACFQDO_06595 [Angustibacter luteus]|uniref:Restriction system protein n=1 Tax=Angustibacter luteus TaxID=658456 RepID=A0ABW1JBW2_9ACTN